MALPAIQVGSLPFQRLTEVNWSTWQIRAKAYLVSLDLWHIVETFPSEASAVQVAQDAKALAVIQLSVSDELLPHLHGIVHAEDAWKVYRNMFERQSSGTKIILMRQLFNLKMQEGSSVQTHITKLVSLFSELRARDIVFPAEQQALILMGSLSSSYYGFVDSLHGLPKEDLNIPFISGKLAEFESQRKLRAPAPPQKAFRGPDKDFGTGTDTACVVKSKSQVVCFKCKKRGHYARNCRQNPEKKGQMSKPDTPSKDFQHSFLVATDVHPEDCFIIDSGCSQHLVKSKELLKNVKDSDINFISLADDSQVEVVCSGELYLDKLGCTLKNVYFVKEIVYNILSVHKLLEAGFEVSLKKDNSLLVNPQGNSFPLVQVNGFFILKSAENEVTACATQIPANPAPLHENCLHEFHRRMGHLSWNYLRKTAELSGMSIKRCDKFLDCSICAAENLKRAPIAKSSARVSKRILELVHIDISGPHPVSIGGSKFFLILVDDFSRLKFTYFMKNKGEAFQRIAAWLKLMKTQFPDTPVQRIQTDRGAEFLSKQMRNLFEKFGVVHRLTNPYSPNENGVAERWIGVLKVVARKMMRDAELSDRFWGEAVANAVHILNRSFCRSVNNIPYVLFLGKLLN